MKTSSGPKSVRKRLSRFAIATILAGAGLLAVAWPAEAEIVYTPTNITIGSNGSYKLDLNNDGVTDFTLSSHFGESKQPTCLYIHASVQEKAASGNDVEGHPPAELVTGDPIGPNQAFYGGTGTSVSYSLCGGKKNSGGKWEANGEIGYLGLSFQINGETYYGWAQLKITVVTNPPLPPAFAATLTGYAYESVPGMPINAGQTK